MLTAIPTCTSLPGRERICSGRHMASPGNTFAACAPPYTGSASTSTGGTTPSPTTRTLHELTRSELDVADPRYPKWATMCRLRLLGLPVLKAVLIRPGEHHSR